MNSYWIHHIYEFICCMSSYTLQDKKNKIFRGIKPLTTILAILLHHRIAWDNNIFLYSYHHKWENDVTKQIRLNNPTSANTYFQNGDIQQTP